MDKRNYFLRASVRQRCSGVHCGGSGRAAHATDIVDLLCDQKTHTFGPGNGNCFFYHRSMLFLLVSFYDTDVSLPFFFGFISQSVQTLPRVLATTVLRRCNSQWRIVSHHAVRMWSSPFTNDQIDVTFSKQDARRRTARMNPHLVQTNKDASSEHSLSEGKCFRDIPRCIICLVVHL